MPKPILFHVLFFVGGGCFSLTFRGELGSVLFISSDHGHTFARSARNAQLKISRRTAALIVSRPLFAQTRTRTHQPTHIDEPACLSPHAAIHLSTHTCTRNTFTISTAKAAREGSIYRCWGPVGLVLNLLPRRSGDRAFWLVKHAERCLQEVVKLLNLLAPA